MKKNRFIVLAEKACYENIENIPKAERELKKLLKRGRDEGNPVLIGASHFYLGMCAYERNDDEGMFTNAYKAVAFLKDTGEYDALVRSYDLLGYAYEQQENFHLQLEVYELAYKLIKKHRLGPVPYLTTINNLGSCHFHLGDVKTAIKALEEGLELLKVHRPDDYSSQLMYSINMAEYCDANGEPEKAVEWLDSVKDIVKKTDYKPYMCDYYLRYAIVSYDLGKKKAAAKHVDKAFYYMEQGEYPHQLYDDLRIVLHLLLKNGENTRAEHVFELMKTYAKERQGVTEQIIAYRAMAEYYTETGSKDDAIRCYALLDELSDKRRKELNRIQLIIHKRVAGTEIDIIKLKRKLAKTEELATLDPLSQLLNRTALMRTATEFMDTAVKKKERIGAIFIDIDYFKQCNDTYGHAKGDEIIREVARICKKEEKQNIRFARYGGDEFFGITKGLTDKEVSDIAKRICKKIQKADIPNKENPNGRRVTVSVGLTNFQVTGPADTIIEIANFADKAVYRSKNAGKNRIYFYDLSKAKQDPSGDPYVRVEF